MKTQHRLAPADQVILFGRKCRLVDQDDHGYVLSEVEQPDMTLRLSYDEFSRLRASPDLEIQAGHFNTSTRLRETKHGESGAFMAAKESERKRALWQYACAQAGWAMYLEGNLLLTDPSIEKNREALRCAAEKLYGREFEERMARAGDALTIPKFPCSKSLRTWMKDLKEAGFHIDGMVSKYYRSGNRDRRLSLEAISLMSHVVDFYATTQRITKSDAIRQTIELFRKRNRKLARQGHPLLEVPSERTVWEFLNSVSPYYLDVKRLGVDAANRKHSLRQSGLDVRMPGERVEVDEYKIDAITFFATTGLLKALPRERIKEIEKGRRFLYLYKDCASKVVLAARLAETPNSDDAIRGLRDVLRDKSHISEAFGCMLPWSMSMRPLTIVADHGTAFTSLAFRNACALIGVGLEHPPLSLAAMRGNGESIFRTVGHKVVPHILGRTFTNSTERGDYPSKDLATLTDDQLIMKVVTWIVDAYHAEPHSGLNGETPFNAWKRFSKANCIPMPPDGHEIRAVFGRQFTRKLNPNGITLNSINYSCDAIREATKHNPNRKVTVLMDPEDLGWVSVKIGRKTYAARANDDLYDGMSYAEWVETRREVRKKYRNEAVVTSEIVREAYARIRELPSREQMLRIELTPFHVTDAEYERQERALGITVRKDPYLAPDGDLEAMVRPPSLPADPLEGGVEIQPNNDQLKSPDASEPSTPNSQKRWSIDDE